MMRANQLKKIKEVDTRRPLAPTRLIKCYVCNEHFDSQPAFESHLKLHKTKLDREEVDELQRKTQESFRKSKTGGMMHKTVSAVGKDNNKMRMAKKEVKKERVENKNIEKEKPLSKEEKEDQEEEEKLQEALRESTILLQKIQMITQPAFEEEKPLEQAYEQESQPIHKYIEGSRQLHQKLLKVKDVEEAEQLIVSTAFETTDWENYEQQLIHLRTLLGYAVNPKTIDQISQIKRRICEDVSAQLRVQYELQAYQQQQKTGKADEVKQRAELKEGTGSQILYCSQCYDQIASYEQYWHCGGQSYHSDCYHPQ